MTSFTRWVGGAGITIAAVLSLSARLDAQASLAAARQLYSSAEYDGALTMLNTLRDGSSPAQEGAPIEFYRALCLVAIGEMGEASEAIASMVGRDPFYRPAVDEVPPRLRAVVGDTRKRLLPSVIQDRYLRAKAAFERSDFKTAKDQFSQVLAALGDPDLGDAVSRSPLADMRLLATGFSDLASRSLAPVPPPPAAVVAPVAERRAEAPPRVFGAEDGDVSAPVALRQVIPPFPGRVTAARTGIVEVIIDDAGSVETAAMLKPLDPLYDRVILSAAKAWAYSPARRDGAPVKYRRRVQIALSPTPN